MRAHRWLAILPAIGMLGGLPLANRVEPYVLGLPFLLFWIVAWVLITSGVMGLIYALDRTVTAGNPAVRSVVVDEEVAGEGEGEGEHG